ncbi:MAG: hypothetical protein ACJAZM_000335 [Cyclobacteriaceae bacterium]|jgi:hypothetical protein
MKTFTKSPEIDSQDRYRIVGDILIHYARFRRQIFLRGRAIEISSGWIFDRVRKEIQSLLAKEGSVELNISLSQANVVGVKYLVNVFACMNKLFQKGYQITVNWQLNETDPDGRKLAADLQEVCLFDFHIMTS